jgi:hypothetical protein
VLADCVCRGEAAFVAAAVRRGNWAVGVGSLGTACVFFTCAPLAACIQRVRAQSGGVGFCGLGARASLPTDHSSRLTCLSPSHKMTRAGEIVQLDEAVR